MEIKDQPYSEMHMKIVGYQRVSTDQQTESGLGLEAQKAACEAYAKRTCQEISEFFRDEGVSGASPLDKRPNLLKAIASLKKGDILIVAKRDRLARESGVMTDIQRAVEKKKAKIISAAGEGTEGDQEGLESYMMRGMTDLFAGVERKMIQARTKAALQAKKERGERVGHIPFGYRLSNDGVHIEKDDLEQSILSQMSELRADGLSIRAIAVELNKREAFNRGLSLWHHASVHRMLKAA